MRIAGVVVKGHPALGDLSLDFRNAAGRASETVVLAGENGCGKTVLLELIYEAFGQMTPPRHPAGPQVTLDVMLEPADAQMAAFNRQGLFTLQNKRLNPPWDDFSGLVLRLYQLLPDILGQNSRYVFDAKTGALEWDHGYLHPLLGSNVGCFFSEARTAFRVPPITSTTASDGSRATMSPELRTRTSDQLTMTFAQLLVDLASADNDDLARWTREHVGEVIPEDPVPSRTAPLKQAFARLMSDKAFVGAVAATAIEVLLKRINTVLDPAYDTVAEKAARVDALLATLNGAGVSADAVLPSATRTFVTPEQRAKIDTAAQAADLKKVAGIRAVGLYLSGF